MTKKQKQDSCGLRVFVFVLLL